MESKPVEIRIYEDEKGQEPYTRWISSLDTVTQARLLARLDRVEKGNFGDCQPVGDSVSELRFHFGPGYRIYFGTVNNTIVLLLAGGTKASQKKDIKVAKQYWKDFQGRSQV